jgi:PST family polysaccharide transporter
MTDLREKTIRGALARVCAQAANLTIRVGSLGILARLLAPKDFGLVGMVTVFTGVLSLFRDFGLSAATVQSPTVTEEQTSTLFWINVLVGMILTVIVLLLAPVVAAFYHDPRLLWITSVVATSFLFNAAGIQHSARLQREMRFTALALIDTGSWLVSTAIAIGAANLGYGYWALVAMTITLPLAGTIAFWFTTGWVPGRPRSQAGIRSLMRFGGTLTLNGVVVYVASNFEKVLLGRFWGADAIGLYGRAYQLSRIPTDTFNSAVGEVAFSALSRLQNDPARLKAYFLKGYSLVLALTLPATLACSLFANDIISVLLGPKWNDAAPIFRFLAPTLLVFAIANPLSWLLGSIGLVGRGLKMSLAIAPAMIAGYVIGLPHGPKGVAFAYSAVMTLWITPVIVWSIHGTVLVLRDILIAVSRPLASSVVAAALAFGLRPLYGPSLMLRLILELTILLAVYLGMLLYVMGQKTFYLDILRKMIGRTPTESNSLVSA